MYNWTAHVYNQENWRKVKRRKPLVSSRVLYIFNCDFIRRPRVYTGLASQQHTSVGSSWFEKSLNHVKREIDCKETVGVLQW